jgi:hypothetical protein
MSNHLMQRLNIAREDPNIRQAVPQGSFRSQQQAIQEAQMMRAAILSKSIAGGRGPPAPAGAMIGRPAPAGPPSNGAAAGAPYPQPSAPRPFMSGPKPAAPIAAPPAAPVLPFVFRRAANDIQITDPSTGDILQLDKGTWVMTAANVQPGTQTLAIYTTDPDTGAVISYDVPIPDGHIARVFDQHTLNPLDTVTVSEA